MELFDIQSLRPSVITPTPPGSPKVHRDFTLLAQRAPISPNSPNCSGISSIGGEVFQELGSLNLTVEKASTSDSLRVKHGTS